MQTDLFIFSPESEFQTTYIQISKIFQMIMLLYMLMNFTITTFIYDKLSITVQIVKIYTLFLTCLDTGRHFEDLPDTEYALSF